MQGAWCEPARPEPCACAFVQGVARASWGYEVKQLDGDYQELALAYQQRLLAKRSHPKIAKEAPAATVLNEPKKIGLEGLQL